MGKAKFIVVLVGISAALAFWFIKRAPQPAPAPQTEATEQTPNAGNDTPTEALPVQVATVAPAEVPAGKAVIAARRVSPEATPPALPARPEAPLYLRQMVGSLIPADEAGLPQTPEQVAAWKQNLHQLVQQGPTGVLAIREFLDKNVDMSFGTEGSKSLGYSSARSAMFDALQQIGGPEATQGLLGALQATADPREISSLAQHLEQMEPERYRSDIIEAARQVLAQAGESRPGDTATDHPEVGPLFDILQKYGGASAVGDLEQASSHWTYYSAIALAQMSDGAGIGALAQMAQGATGAKSVAALELLSQSAMQYPEARSALVDQARAGQISAHTWAYLEPVLAGDQIQYSDGSAGRNTVPAGSADVRAFHIESGNQNFFSAPPQAMTADQVTKQVGLIDDLMAATTRDPAAQQALQSVRAKVMSRMPKS
jgi:hypothetical protein